MRILFLIGILFICLELFTINVVAGSFKKSRKISKFFKKVKQASDIYEKVSKSELPSLIGKGIDYLSKKPDKDTPRNPKPSLPTNYEQDFELPKILFESIELFFDDPCEELLANLKRSCDKYPPLDTLKYLKGKLNHTDSIYKKKLETFNFESKYVDSVMRKLQDAVTKLVMSYGVCRSLLTSDDKESTRHIEEITESIITSIRAQRRIASNWLTPEAVHQHLQGLSIPQCSKMLNQSKSSDWKSECAYTSSESIPDCVSPANGGWKRMMFVYDPSTTETRHGDDIFSCMRAITRFIYEDLIDSYNYGKHWTVLISPYPCYGNMDANTVQIKVESFTVTVYFSNSVKTPVTMPFEDIEDALGSKLGNFFGMFRFWNSICPLPFTSKKTFMENIYDKIESDEYCMDRNFCIVCAETSSGYVTDNNVDVKLFDPCVGRSSIPVIMGPKYSQEQQYPSDDSQDDDIMECLMNLQKKMTDLRKEYKKAIKRIQEFLPPEDVPMGFREHVDKVLQDEWMGEECEEKLWGKTPFGQHFVLVISKVVWYAVRLIVDEENRDLEIVRQRDVHTSDVLEKSQHWTLEGALEYRNKIHQELSDGIFPDHVAYRIRKLPSDCVDNPAFYLKPGDHIQRRLDSAIPFANHEGIYLGNGKVAHINTENVTADGITVFSEKSEAYARVDGISRFVTYHDQEIRIVVHCLRRRSREDICETAMRLVKERYREGEYHFLQQNCQHFASYCALGVEWMSDKADLIEKGVIYGSAALMGLTFFYSFFNRNEPETVETSREEEREASTSRR